MQLTIDIKESALDKVMYLLEHLKSDVKIIDNSKQLDIQAIKEDDQDYQHILKSREKRKTHPQNYGTVDEINWD